MKNKRRNREAFAQHSYWQSYSDMMAALLLIFILIIAITLAIYKQKTTALEKTQLALDQAREQLNLTMEDLERSKAEIEKSNEELASSLAELQQAYEQAALTQEELNKAYLEIESARNELTVTKNELQDIVGVRTDIIGGQQENAERDYSHVSGCPSAGSVQGIYCGDYHRGPHGHGRRLSEQYGVIL